VAFAAASTFVRLLSARSEDDPAEISFMTVTVILLATVALCIKLSAGALAASMGLLALTVYLIRTPHSPWRRATIIWSCGLSFALLATWVARSVILSGCPIYPSRILAAPVEWCAPSEAAGGLRAEFRSDSQRNRM